MKENDVADLDITDEAVQRAAQVYWETEGNRAVCMRAALVAALPLLAQPVVDREAVREEVRAGLNSALCNGGHPDTGWSPSAEVDRITDAVLALLNGTANDPGPIVPDSAVCDHDDTKPDDYGATRCTHCGLVF